MRMTSQMARIEPEIRIQWRGTSIRPVIPVDVGLVIAGAEMRRVHYAVLRRMIHHVAECPVSVKDQDIGVGVRGLEGPGVLLQRRVEPRDLRGVRAGVGSRLIAGCSVQRGQVHEEIGAVAEGVEVLDGGEQRVHQSIVETGEVDAELGAVVDVVDADPDGDQCLGGLDYVPEDGVAELLVLGDLVDEGDGEVVMERQTIDGVAKSGIVRPDRQPLVLTVQLKCPRPRTQSPRVVFYSSAARLVPRGLRSR